MADDREVLREVWESCLPVCLTVSSDEVVSMQRPDPYYLLLPRVSYFPIFVDRIIKHFSPFVSSSCQNGQNMWLECDGQKLKW